MLWAHCFWTHKEYLGIDLVYTTMKIMFCITGWEGGKYRHTCDVGHLQYLTWPKPGSILQYLLLLTHTCRIQTASSHRLALAMQISWVRIPPEWFSCGFSFHRTRGKVLHVQCLHIGVKGETKHICFLDGSASLLWTQHSSVLFFRPLLPWESFLYTPLSFPIIGLSCSYSTLLWGFKYHHLF